MLFRSLSENISVVSIVGKFLEHSRIYFFYNQGKQDYYLSSADWMERNLNRRIETLFPVEDEALKAQLEHILVITLKDTLKTRIMQSNGQYRRIDRRGKELLSCQKYFCEEAEEAFLNAKKAFSSKKEREIR